MWTAVEWPAAHLALAPSMDPPSSMLLAPSWTLSSTLASVASATMLLAMLPCLRGANRTPVSPVILESNDLRLQQSPGLQHVGAEQRTPRDNMWAHVKCDTWMMAFEA